MNKAEKETMFVSFSGGRTSGYMCWWLLNNVAHKYNFIFVFANTGQEHESTLKFVNQCDKYFGLHLVWVEAAFNAEKGKGTRHKIVNFETAHRGGDLFEGMASIYGIPNAAYPHCNRELKLQPIKSYKRSLGLKTNHTTAIGIRIDEIDRMSAAAKEDGLMYPLIKWTRVTKASIIHWWLEQPFNLELSGEHFGNCVTCWKKSDRKLFTIALHEPELFEVFDLLEKKYGHINAPDKDRVFFRKHRNTQDIIASSLQSFVEFVEPRPEYQFEFVLDIDELDREEDCGANSCEAA